jgi:hypothetical protein
MASNLERNHGNFRAESSGLEEYMSPGEFIAITSSNVREVVFEKSPPWDGNLGHLPDKVVISCLDRTNSKPETIPQFELFLNLGLNNEQMALALLDQVDRIKHQLRIKTEGSIPLKDDKPATTEQKRVFYQQNKDLVEKYLDREIVKNLH